MSIDEKTQMGELAQIVHPDKKWALSLFLFVGLIGVLILSLSGVVFAQGKKEDKKERDVIRSTTKKVSGEISAIRKDFIAIVYSRDEKRGSEEEIGLPIEASVKIENKKTLEQISVGDIVEVQYEEVGEQTKEGPMTKRVARVIRFVRPASKQPESTILDSEAEPVPEE